MHSAEPSFAAKVLISLVFGSVLLISQVAAAQRANRNPAPARPSLSTPTPSRKRVSARARHA